MKKTKHTIVEIHPDVFFHMLGLPDEVKYEGCVISWRHGRQVIEMGLSGEGLSKEFIALEGSEPKRAIIHLDQLYDEKTNRKSVAFKGIAPVEY